MSTEGKTTTVSITETISVSDSTKIVQRIGLDDCLVDSGNEKNGKKQLTVDFNKLFAYLSVLEKRVEELEGVSTPSATD